MAALLAAAPAGAHDQCEGLGPAEALRCVLDAMEYESRLDEIRTCSQLLLKNALVLVGKHIGVRPGELGTIPLVGMEARLEAAVAAEAKAIELMLLALFVLHETDETQALDICLDKMD